MMRNHFSTHIHLFVVVLALLVIPAANSKLCVPGEPTPESYTWNFKSEVSDLLDETKYRASRVKEHAAELQSFVRRPGQRSWDSHAAEWTQVREQVNRLGEDLCRMHLVRHEGRPWQQDAIDRITPDVVTLAHHTEAAITFLNEDGRLSLTSETYQTHTDRVYARARSLGRLADSAVERADLRSPSDASHQGIKLAASFCGF